MVAVVVVVVVVLDGNYSRFYTFSIITSMD